MRSGAALLAGRYFRLLLVMFEHVPLGAGLFVRLVRLLLFNRNMRVALEQHEGCNHHRHAGAELQGRKWVFLTDEVFEKGHVENHHHYADHLGLEVETAVSGRLAESVDRLGFRLFFLLHAQVAVIKELLRESRAGCLFDPVLDAHPSGLVTKTGMRSSLFAQAIKRSATSSASAIVMCISRYR